MTLMHLGTFWTHAPSYQYFMKKWLVLKLRLPWFGTLWKFYGSPLHLQTVQFYLKGDFMEEKEKKKMKKDKYHYSYHHSWWVKRWGRLMLIIVVISRVSRWWPRRVALGRCWHSRRSNRGMLEWRSILLANYRRINPWWMGSLIWILKRLNKAEWRNTNARVA